MRLKKPSFVLVMTTCVSICMPLMMQAAVNQVSRAGRANPLFQAFEKGQKELEEEGISPAKNQPEQARSEEQQVAVQPQEEQKAPELDKAVSTATDELSFTRRPDPTADAAQASGQATGRKIGKYLAPDGCDAAEGKSIAEAK